ncbi:MAG: hypothetical protein Fur0022_27040 [Anaerolineales bacterium]
MKHSYFLILLVFLFASLACQVGAPTVEPLPTVDNEATIAAAVQATQAAQPTATPTPSPAPTQTPLPTETPPPTEPPTLTPLPTGAVTAEAAIADWTRYDFWADGFSISLPNFWQPITTDQATMDNIMNAAGENNANIQAMFSSEYMQALVSQGIKLMALDTSRESLLSDAPTNFNLLSVELPINVDLDTLIDATLGQLEQMFSLSEPLERERVTLGADQLEAERLIYVVDQVNVIGQPITARLVQYIILDGKMQYVLTFSSNAEELDAPLPIFDEIAQTFDLIEP